jgi:hypothetical protein
MGLENLAQLDVIKAGASLRRMRPYQFVMRPYQLPLINASSSLIKASYYYY